MPLIQLALAATGILTVAWFIGRYKWSQRLRGCSMPPGPKGWPIIGNLLDLSTGQKPWLLYTQWADIYGMHEKSPRKYSPDGSV